MLASTSVTRHLRAAPESHRPVMASTPEPQPDAPALVAIVGAGQLARMLAACALRLGLRVRCLAEHSDDPACALGEVVIGSADDPAALRELVTGATVVTFEHEWADAQTLARALPDVGFRPGLASLAVVADKREQRRRLTAAGIPQPEHCVAQSPASASAFAATCKGGLVAKRGRGGYDGYGVRRVGSAQDLGTAFAAYDDGGGVLFERWVPFVRELAVCVARSVDGTTATYPVVECGSERHACAWVVAPARIDLAVAARAREIAVAAVEALDCVGVATVELFELPDGEILVNEVSPRVHNTAHWTIEGAHTSQYENHLRAILGWPLGETGMRHTSVAMANVFGSDGTDPRARIARALAVPRVAVHTYGKNRWPAGRKLGHVTAWGEARDECLQRARAAADLLMGGSGEARP